jgi:uncharacterized protein (TIGR02453 family)
MHFSQGYIDFFNQLKSNNSKRWFNENRKWYELIVREPFKDFIDLLLPEIKKLDPEISMTPKDALFRVNRDLRFSTGEEPYKTHMAAGFSRGGKKSQFAGFYLQVGLNHIVIGGGLPFIEKDVLRKIRIEIGYNRDAFQEIIEDEQFEKYFGFVHGEFEKSLPKSFVDVSEESPIIANKQFYYGAIFDTESLLFDEKLPEIIIDHFRAGVPFNNFLIKAISNFTNQKIPVRPRKVYQY